MSTLRRLKLKTLKSALLKIVEFVGYALLIGYVVKLFKGQPVGSIPVSVDDELDSIDESSNDDLVASEESYEDQVQQIESEENRIMDLDGNALTSEFDREFGGVQIVTSDGSD